jgi:hypothetical protein
VVPEKAREHCGHGRGARDDGANREETEVVERTSARVVRGSDIFVGITQEASALGYIMNRCVGGVEVDKPSMFVTQSFAMSWRRKGTRHLLHRRANHIRVLGNYAKDVSPVKHATKTMCILFSVRQCGVQQRLCLPA